MKFSDIDRERWDELKPYLDTVLLPVSGLTGAESPWEATVMLEKLRDALDPLEQLYKGRVVTYPAVHYAESDERLERLVGEMCGRLTAGGFRYCVVVSGNERLAAFRPKEASLVVVPEAGEAAEEGANYRARIRKAVESLWFGGGAVGST
ncbi:DUF2487 family protein [Paenibacillus thermotolerans]|uniref:DUF2487 family protein n=1 Tax=Paenibacillus thermotolerans TaxID=3027807 RepID=UPI00236884C7|nr:MULTISPECIES: DUF2487 family protein [unclassified Paenibacillus]